MESSDETDGDHWQELWRERTCRQLLGEAIGRWVR